MTLKVVAGVALLVVVLAFAGVRVIHPQTGLKSALGNADTSIAIYFKTSEISKGQKVIVHTGLGSADPVLASVNKVTGDDVDLQVGTSLQRVSAKKNIQGKLILILPFLGYIAP
jgi:precorrin-4 methylase